MKKLPNYLSATEVKFPTKVTTPIVIHLQSCRKDQKDAYREEQCSQYDGQTYGGINYEWKPVNYNLGLSTSVQIR